MRPLARGNDYGAALLYNLGELSRKPNQNKSLEEIMTTLLEARAGLDHIVIFTCPRSAGIRGEQLVDTAEHIPQRQ